jgi:branched-chain amino acid transport system substrate-binding protein
LGRRGAAGAVALAAAVLAIAGCGEGGGVADGATMTVYASAPKCAAAKRALARQGASAGSIRLRVLCLDPSEEPGRLDLAAIGANARRATEDSTTVAYLAEPDSTAARFSKAILEEAGIAQLPDRSAAAAIAAVREAIGGAREGESPREAVYER